MKHTPDIRALLRHIERAQAFLRWLREEGDHLVASAQLLGGPACAARACAVVGAARAGYDLSTRRDAIVALHRLLHLDFARDLERPEVM
ncbi:MAG: hypothetical protein ACP5DX_09575 [Paracoccaceae bacterium]